jgi:hypothetical protein
MTKNENWLSFMQPELQPSQEADPGPEAFDAGHPGVVLLAAVVGAAAERSDPRRRKSTSLVGVTCRRHLSTSHVRCISLAWDRCYNFKNILAEKFREKIWRF